MNPTEQMKRQQQYKTYVDQKTPRHNLWLNMLRAFLTGGAVCVLGQIIFNLCELQKLSQDDCSNWTSMLLVLISVILTGTGIYPKLAKWGGAGALVPITGFANSVAAPAIEYKKEGQVFGIGCKIFTIAGPVILYGIFTSWFLGLGDDLIPRLLPGQLCRQPPSRMPVTALSIPPCLLSWMQAAIRSALLFMLSQKQGTAQSAPLHSQCTGNMEQAASLLPHPLTHGSSKNLPSL